jgi:hypothetical protein
MQVAEHAEAHGRFAAQCLGPADPADGERIVAYVATHPELHGHQTPNIEAARILGIELVERWASDEPNTVCTAGKNLALDTFLAGSAYTVTGPFLGLISSVSYSAIAAGDTMSSHAGWLEAGGANAPTYTAPRKTAAWNAASAGSKALSAALSFAITGTGTVKGSFLVFGTGALSTIDNTAGTLYSAGLFGAGDRAVLSGDTLNVSWSGSM